MLHASSKIHLPSRGQEGPSRLLLSFLLAVGLEAAIAASISAPVSAQTVSGPLAPPPGNVPLLTLHARGTQNYICLPVANRPDATSWVFERPEAALSLPLAGITSVDVTVHALLTVPALVSAPDPACTEAADLSHEYCPAWHSTLDQSTVWGKKVMSETAGSASDCPNNGAIACLLVKAVANTGARHLSLFGDTTFIQRLNTRGGAQPKIACVAGQVEQVPYSADYSFFRAG